MAKLNGYIRVPVPKVQRALKFAKAYKNKYTERNKALYAQAYDTIVEQEVGKRSLSRAFWMVPLSKKEAESIAHSRLNMCGTTLWPNVCTVTGADYAEVKRGIEVTGQLELYTSDLQTLFDAGHHLDYILLDVDSCAVIQGIIQMAEEERFA